MIATSADVSPGSGARGVGIPVLRIQNDTWPLTKSEFLDCCWTMVHLILR